MITADNIATIWVNQKLVAQPVNNRIWNKAQEYVFTECLEVIAVAITNTGGPGGLLGSFDNGVLTDGSWRCSEKAPSPQWTSSKFDDSVMPRATVYGEHRLITGISPEAKWIGSRNPNAPKMFCRLSFKLGNYNLWSYYQGLVQLVTDFVFP